MNKLTNISNGAPAFSGRRSSCRPFGAIQTLAVIRRRALVRTWTIDPVSRPAGLLLVSGVRATRIPLPNATLMTERRPKFPSPHDGDPP